MLDDDAAHIHQFKLVVVRGPKRGREFVFSRDVISVGKASDNDLVLTDDTVSREHCEISHGIRGYVLRDLESTNGTILDGAEISKAHLHDGAVITVGKVQLKFLLIPERRTATRRKNTVRPGEISDVDAALTQALKFDAGASYRQNKERWDLEFERRYLGWLLERAGGNISRAAREADMDRKYLHKLLKKHQITR